jgi:hypothetical protein
MRLVITFLLLISFGQLFLPRPSQKSLQDGCPVITVTCPDMAEAGGELTFKANVSGTDPGLKLSYTWAVSDKMTIVSGQGTSALTVRLSDGNSYTATVEVEGLARGCSNKAACSVVSCNLSPARLFDTFTNLSFNKEAARLKNFASQLRNEPGAVGYIIVYAGRKDNAGAAQSHAYRLKNWLVKEYGFEDGLITTVDGGYREAPAVELFVVPTGSMPPTASPTINPEETDN